MSPSKLPAMALSYHERYILPPRPQKGLQSSRGTQIRAFWRQLLSTFRYIRLKREGARLMGEYVRVAEALGFPLHLSPQTAQQQQRLMRVHEIQQEMAVLRYGPSQREERRMAQGEA